MSFGRPGRPGRSVGVVLYEVEPRTARPHRAGPWPGWLKWWRDSGGWARDARIYELYGDMTQAEVARIVGCSPSTVHRAVKRQMQLRAGAWPPAVSNGFGLSYAKRRALRLRQGMEQETYPSQMAAPGVNAYEMPPELQSRYDENGDEAW